MVHAGLPLKSGVDVGLNIWSRTSVSGRRSRNDDIYIAVVMVLYRY
jgi:hypothetical protein